MKKAKRIGAILVSALTLITALSAGACSKNTGDPSNIDIPEHFTVDKITVGEKAFTGETKTVYVSPDGVAPDGNEVFLTPEAAQEHARKLAADGVKTEIIIADGEYSTRGLIFDKRDNGSVYRAANKGKAVITGGLTVPASDFKVPSDEILQRLPEKARQSVKMINLTELGFTADDWKGISAIGSRCTGPQYDSAEQAPNMELFMGNERMHLSRYPNDGKLYLAGVVEEGEEPGGYAWYYYLEFPESTQRREYSIHDPEPGIYEMDSETNERAKTWTSSDDIWLYGMLKHDYVDESTPVKLDTEKSQILPAFRARCGAEEGKPYYFFNILEELDVPGEYYLDRVSGELYFIPTDNGDLTVAMQTSPLIYAKDVEDITFDGLTLTCTRDNAAVFEGKAEYISLLDLTVKNIGGIGAVFFNASNCTVTDCELSCLGQGGIYMRGGDRATFTYGNNTVTNNYIHDYGEVYKTNHPGINLIGCGNLCANNEICSAPHQAINYLGNDLLIEYNYIHDVNLETYDAGAIYAGWDWSVQGCVVRYNLLENIGDTKERSDFSANGIYWDDGTSGQTAYGNILINITGNGFLIGGGRDNRAYDNIIINSGAAAIKYDDRFCDGEWANGSVSSADSGLWASLNNMPYKNDRWTEKYPTLAMITPLSDDPDVRANDINYPSNPSYAELHGNIVISTQKKDKAYDIDSAVIRFGNVSLLKPYRTCEKAGFDIKELKFTDSEKLTADIPISQIGCPSRGYLASRAE